MAQRLSGQHVAHHEDQQRKGEHQAEPEARVMSTSSGSGRSSAVTVSGSSAMPQMGQPPGPFCRTCGCIGHV